MKYSMVKIQIPGHKVMCTINLVDIPALVRCGLHWVQYLEDTVQVSCKGSCFRGLFILQ